MLITGNHGLALGRIHCICCSEHERVAVGVGCESGVTETAVEFVGEGVGPDGAGDSVAEGGTDVVGCEEEAGDDGDVLVLGRSLDRSLGWVGE